MPEADLAHRIALLLEELTDNSPANYVAPGSELVPSAAGMRLFAHPLVAVGAASDPLFAQLHDSAEARLQMLMPGDWVEGAQSVVSYFFPISEQARTSNRASGHASAEWCHARIDGQKFVLQAGRAVVEMLRSAGHGAVCPADDERMQAVFASPPGGDDAQNQEALANPFGSFTSNWSERHVAYVCGLGTFSLSKGIITAAGMAGRFGSVVTSAHVPTTQRAYRDLYEYCIMCGACVERCPVGAISFEHGKDHELCYGEMTFSKQLYPGYLGCGKCQVRVPCECARPGEGLCSR